MSRSRRTSKPPSPEPRRSDSKAIVEAILIAGRELAESGIEHVTMKAVAERAGVGEASVFRYFAGKEALFAELFRVQHAKILESLRLQLRQADSIHDGIVRCVEAFAGFGPQEHRFRRALNIELPLAWTLDELDKAIGDVRNVFEDWLSDRMPHVRRDEIERRVFYAVAQVRGAVTLRLLQPDRCPTVEALVDELSRYTTAIIVGPQDTGD